ncbi:MAG: EAL domain-containing protein [Lachnospiraceae bacterium]|nr:EAL domain-containing protein [Lachnospiraceae bacterium]
MDTAASLPDYSAFCASAERLLRDGEDRPFALAAIDIDFFKLFNEIHGREAGDRIISDTAGLLQTFAATAGGVAGYFGSDDFALFLPWEDTDKDAFYTSLSSSALFEYRDGFFPSVGIYPVTDRTESADVMYERARIALNSIRGSFTEHVAVYDAEKHERLRKELRLLLDARRGLKNGEFLFHLQPKCDMNNGKIIGAEALVRWQSADSGMISPGAFIPVLERHNYITTLDCYVWDAVCRWQRSLLDEGFDPLPVSVNVSRKDFLEMDIAEHFLALTEKYNLPHELIELEITESAFVDSSLDLKGAIRRLREEGFHILMDDFGTGYSSLHSLRDLSFDILKTDIRFLDKGGQSRRGIDIMESVLNMARLLGVPMIVEGVETADQVEDLLSIGCSYAQGYYFHKPVPVDVYMQMVQNPYNVDRGGMTVQREEQIRLSEFLDANMYSDETLNSILGAVAFVEDDGEHLRLVRSNERFDRLIHTLLSTDDPAYSFVHDLSTYAEEMKRLLRIAEMNLVDGCSEMLVMKNSEGDTVRVHIRVFMLNERDGRKLFYMSAEKIEPKWSDEDLWRELQETQARLSFLRAALNRLPNPIFLKDAEARFLFFNDQYAKAFGMRRADYIGKTVLDLEYLPKDDRERFQKEDEELIRKESELSYESEFLFSDDTSHLALYWSTGVHDKKTDRRGLIGEIVDISRHKKT